MIDYKKFYFATAPGTGSSWFVKAAQLAGLGYAPRERAFDGFSSDDDRLKITLVRHPCAWLVDLWCRKSFDPRPISHVGRLGELVGEEFSLFVEDYLQKMPGEIGRLFYLYDADSYIRSEDFPLAFVELAESMGVERGLLQNDFFHKCPLQSNSRSNYTVMQWRAIIEAEWELVQFFDYW